MDKEDFEYFDDCDICKVQKRADESGEDVSASELTKAFKEQAKKYPDTSYISE